MFYLKGLDQAIKTNSRLSKVSKFVSTFDSKYVFVVIHILKNYRRYLLLLEPSVYPFNTLHVCYRHIEDVHEDLFV